MALPVGVTTATITFGVPVSFTGAFVRSTVSIVPSAPLVHTATGTPLINFLEDVIVSEGTSGQFVLPHTDQTGFADESGNSYQNWYYTATITYSTDKGTLPARTKVFQLTSGQTLVDLDLIPAGAPVLPFTAPTAAVSSVNGRTGAVTIQDNDLPERLSDESLTATIGDQIEADALPRGGTVNWTEPEPLINIYPSGSGAGMHFASQTGFSGPYLVGFGVDHDGVTGLVMSVKRNGTAMNFDQWPAGGVGEQLSNRSAIPIQNFDIYAGAGGVQYALKSGQGFTDGVTVAGSAVFTSATAAFVAGDVGKVLSSVQPYPNAIPAGTTILSVQSGTSVTLSAPAAETRNPLSFMVAGRAPATTQKVFRVFDTDSSTVLFGVTKGAITAAIPVTARDSATSAFRVYGVAGQTADLQSWRDSNTNILSRVNKDGYIMTRKATAPADADLANGEMCIWFDPTPGTGGFRVKGKATDGTIITKSL